MLEINGFRVLQAASGYEAVRLLEQTPVDLVVTSYAMALMDGIELSKRLKVMWPYMPILLLGDLKALSSRLYVADSVLDKETSQATLLERIKDMSVGKRGPRKGTPRAPGLAGSDAAREGGPCKAAL